LGTYADECRLFSNLSISDEALAAARALPSLSGGISTGGEVKQPDGDLCADRYLP
jgi:hypothetical protein